MERSRFDDTTYRESEIFVEQSHLFGITRCEVIIHSDDMDTLASESVEVGRHRGDEGLSFSCFHLRDSSLVEIDRSDDLHIVGYHCPGLWLSLHHIFCPHETLTRLLEETKCFRKDVIE